MHSLNAIFLLGDAALNSLVYLRFLQMKYTVVAIYSNYSYLIFEFSLLQSFPCFRIAYFFLWTIAYVLFQWTLHSLVHIW